MSRIAEVLGADLFEFDRRDIEQLCMLSPVWTFTTQIAKPIVDLSSALTLLTPTPEFWGHPKGRTGTNHPHAVIYIGDRVAEFRQAFRKFGIPVKLLNDAAPWDDMWTKPFERPELVWGQDAPCDISGA